MKKLFILALCIIKATMACNTDIEQKLKEFSENNFWIHEETGQKRTFKFEYKSDNAFRVGELISDGASFWSYTKKDKDTNEYTLTHYTGQLVLSIEKSKMQKMCHDGKISNFQTKNEPISAELQEKIKNEEIILKKLEEYNIKKLEDNGWTLKEELSWNIKVERLPDDKLRVMIDDRDCYYLYPKNNELHAEYETSPEEKVKVTVNLKTFTLQVIQNGRTMKNKYLPPIIESKQHNQSNASRPIFSMGKPCINGKKQEKETNIQKTQAKDTIAQEEAKDTIAQQEAKDTIAQEEAKSTKEAEENDIAKSTEEKQWCFPEGYIILTAVLSIFNFLLFRWCLFGRSPLNWTYPAEETEEFISDEFISEEFTI